MPIDALVSPFPSELTTPPVTKMCLVIEDPPDDSILLPQKPRKTRETTGRQKGRESSLNRQDQGPQIPGTVS
jgi:hypothetical protein